MYSYPSSQGSSKSASIDVDMELEDGSDDEESSLQIIDDDDDDMFADVPCQWQFAELCK